MKKQVTTILFSALLLSGCASSRMGDPGAIVAGASIGSNLGGTIGGILGDNGYSWRGSYRGSAIGSIVGMVAGAAIGNALTAPKDDPIEEYAYAPKVNNRNSQSNMSQLRIHKIRFIDDNRNHFINENESSKIIFEIMNEGHTPVYNVIPIVETIGKVKRIYISPAVMVERILPGEGIRYTASIHAGNRLRGDEVRFRVAVADEQRTICDTQEFTLPIGR